MGISPLTRLVSSSIDPVLPQLVGKLFAGIGVGCMQLALPTYISEIAPYKIRGAMVAFYNIW
jgi:MFS family permease